MQHKISRRALVQAGLLAATVVPVLGIFPNSAAAASLPALDPADPTAKALGFVTDTTKVDPSANSTHKPTQRCGVCAQFQGKPGDASGGCNIFAGKSVPEGGWCKVWVQKPAA
jgi:High potential iron-sulfur protein